MIGVLVVNAGSSSLKLRVLGPDDAVTTALDLSPWDGHRGFQGHGVRGLPRGRRSAPPG
jgi:hypothetical protein